MLFTFPAQFVALALTFSLLPCFPLYAQTPPAQPTPTQAPAVPAPAAVQDAPPPKPGEVVRPWQPGDPEPKGPLQIVVIEGQDGVNIVSKRKKGVRPVVEIRDGKNTPISGASVTFSSPTDGPSVIFSNGLRSVEVLTDATGRATLEDLKPLSLGEFQLTVAATFRSLSATSTISMTNALKAAPKEASVTSGASHGSSGISGKTVAILVGVAAAAAIGIGVGLSHHGAASASSSSTTATIGTGSGGTVGAPH